MGKKRGPYKERASNQPPSELPALTGRTAIRAMIPSMIAVEAILQGPESIMTALLAVLAAEEKRGPGGTGRSLSNAWRELLARSKAVPPETLARARKARALLQRAQAAYNEAIAPIQQVLETP